MNSLKFLKNSSGMGLVEVMMAVAITGGLTLTIAKLMDNAGQSAKQIEAKSENTSLKGLIQDVLNNPTACQNTFGAVMTSANVTALSASSTATVTLPNIKDKLNVIKYSTASTNIDPLTITSMQLTNYNALAFTGDLVINSTFKKSVNIVMMVKPLRIPINFSFTSGSLTSCSTMAVGGEWLLGGNSGTVDGTDYIGTSDATALNIKVNAQKSGRIEHVYGQTFFGYQAGMSQISNEDGTAFGYQASKSNTTGANNSSFGWVALRQNTTGFENSAFGNGSMQANTTGNSNVAFGASSLTNNTTGAYNIAVGTNALRAATTASGNVAMGPNSMWNHSTGDFNTTLGYTAMQMSTTSFQNTAVGAIALRQTTTGSQNVAVGYSALNLNTTGAQNASVGHVSLTQNTTGTNNTAIGFFAGGENTTGSSNVFIGSNSGDGATTASSKLYIDTLGGPNPLIGGDFSSAGRYVTINNKLGVGLTTGTIPQSTVAIGSSGGTASTKLYVDFQEPYAAGGKTGIYSRVNPAGYFGEWSYGIQASNFSPDTGHGFMVGLRADASAQTPGGSGRAYGAWASAGNASDGYNYGLVAMLTGTARGTAIWASSQLGDWPQTTDAFMSLNQRWAAILNGHVYVKDGIWANAHITTSDIRLKKNIKNLDNSLEKVLKLRGVSYDWKNDSAAAGPQIGLIAQEVEPLFPEVVSSKGNGKAMKAVNYSALIAPIIESIKTLYAKILALITSDEKQNLEIKELKRENDKLKLEMKQQQESFDLRMKKLEAQSANK